MPTSAVWVGATQTAEVTFSHPLQVDAAGDMGNWFVRQSNVARLMLGVSIGAGPGNTRVDLTTLPGAANIGPDVVSFSPPPFDVISDTAKPTPAPAFTDFPLV